MSQGIRKRSGSGHVLLIINGQLIAELESIRIQWPSTIGRIENIQPLGREHPIGFSAPRFFAEGTLTLSTSELWKERSWDRVLPSLRDITAFDQTGPQNQPTCLYDILKKQAQLPEIQYMLVEKIPQINSDQPSEYRITTFHNCLIDPNGLNGLTTVTNEGGVVQDSITVNYTHFSERYSTGASPISGWNEPRTDQLL
jgi:hypothetical protein